MSIKLMTTVWEKDVSGTKRDILFAMADHANDDGICWPSIDLLSWKVGVDRRTVQRNLTTLKKDEVVEVKEYQNGGRQKVPVYRIHLEKIADKPAYEKGGKTPPPETERAAQLCREKGGIAVSPEPSIEPPYTSSKGGEPPKDEQKPIPHVDKKEAVEESQDAWTIASNPNLLADLITSCVDIDFWPSAEQKKGWGRDIKKMREDDIPRAKYYQLRAKVLEGAAHGWYRSFKRAEELLDGAGADPYKRNGNGHKEPYKPTLSPGTRIC